ncbi:unnamed protein product [Moneuplotes crassus]|uniref:Importin N-terminal domain-containing protein n=1 Tax=Euplotes crassus TaxID=5936 RepID=A0AAD2D082_EUPCR|nr:unnamed protein product [Moneuplotes crassus]
MENSDIEVLTQILTEAQSSDNAVRKEAEKKLLESKKTQPENYCVYLFNVLMNKEMAQNVRVLTAILLRSAFLATQKHDTNCWGKLSKENREFIEKQIFEVIAAEEDKIIIPHLANLLSEIIGSLYEIEDQIRLTETHELCKRFIESGAQTQVLAALNIYIGIFEKLFNEIISVKDDLITIFNVTMASEDTEISFMGLKTLCKLVIILERQHSEHFIHLVENMIKVTMNAFDRDDEDTLEKCLVEFKAVTSVEPRFLVSSFNEMCTSFKKIMQKKDFEKKTIRILPVELISTIIVRLKTVFQNKLKIVEKVVEVFYHVMIDIDEELDDEWINPDDGTRIEEEEFSTDPVHVCSKSIDNFIRELGATKMLPIVKSLIEVRGNLSEVQDWRIINANLMIIACLGEYIDNIYDAEPLAQQAIKNYYHEHPKVRYAAFHVIGQMSTDLQPAFQTHFEKHLLNTMVQSLDDKFPRLQAHAAASLTNFLEGCTDDIVASHIETLATKLIQIIHEGNTMCKENAVTCLATVAEAAESLYEPYFEETIKSLSPFLVENSGLQYYQFKGQLIESIVIICVAVGIDIFRPHSEDLISILLKIQNSIFDETGVTQTNTTIDKSFEHHVLQSYLLTAWEKLCYLMNEEFIPYLDQIVPTLLKIASLNSEFKTAEEENLFTDQTEDNNIVSSEIDEKNSALQMIEAFVRELKSGFAAYVEPVSQILIPMLTFKQSETIRSSSASCIHGLMVSVIEGCPDDRDLQVRVAEKYLDELWSASKIENETEVLGVQCQAIRDVIKEMKSPFMSEEVVNAMCKKCIEMLKNSDKRKLINEDYSKDNIQSQGENIDHEDFELMKMENYNEDEFQIAISEIFGSLFKTHKEYCGALCKTLFDDILPEYLNESGPDIKKRFSLYIMVDMIEHLGYDYIKDQFDSLIEFLIQYSSSEVTVLRQSALFGLGMAAVWCKEGFTSFVEKAVELCKIACDIPQGDQDKEEYLHCRDNAVSSLGKIIQNYAEGDNMDELMVFWIERMPIKLDLEESKEMNQLLLELLKNKLDLILGADLSRLQPVVDMIGEQLHSLYMRKETIKGFGVLLNDLQSIPTINEVFEEISNDIAKSRIRKAIQEAKQP